MLLLAVDTSGRNGSISLARCSPPNLCEIFEVAALEGGTFSAQLVPQIALLLSGHGVDKNDLDAFAVVSGPGSFTGLRVGLAAIKALGEILAKPIAPVSFLEVVATAGQAQTKCLAALDAGRNQIYVGEYDGKRIVSEQLLTPQEFFNFSKDLTVITPDANVAAAASSAGFAVQQTARPRADAVATLGWQKIQSGEVASPEELEANYLRRTDAELFSPPRQD
jgi:tRNA threonylcarbamoyladenosine biosynthesis protein TsaB